MGISRDVKYVLIIGVTTILIGCQSNKYYEEFKQVENASWKAKEQLSFQVNAIDSNTKYDLFVVVRNTKSYKYQNLYLFVDIMAPSGKLERDTIECLLADVGGKWFGNSAGDVIDNKIWFRTNFQFKELGKYHFLFEQAMREDELKEIIDFGICVEEKK